MLIKKIVDGAGLQNTVLNDYSESQSDAYSCDYVNGIGVKPSDLLDYIYPIGSIYMSVNNVSPQVFLGGTWEQIKDTFLLSAGDTYTAGSTGGEAEHTLTVDEMPSHSHNMKVTQNGYEGNKNIYRLSASGSASSSFNTNTGGNQAHNNMPPYLTVYMWKRIADAIEEE